MHTGPNIVNDGLVFGYDTGYGVADNNTSNRFYHGKPTVNTWYQNTYSYTNGDATATRNATPPISPPPEAQGFEVYKLQSNNGTLVQGIAWTSQVDQVNGGTYVHSVYCYLESGTIITVGQHWNPWSYGSSQYPPQGKWVRLFQTVTNSANNYGNIANAYRTNGVAYFTATQYELGSIPTPFVDSSRSSTQSLIDLTKTRNIDVSNVSFDSVGQPILDGTDDFIDLGTDVTFKSSGGWTVESMVKYNSVAGGYNNVTSPANFIGSDSILHNSWYWSVLSGKLALWNRSPGTWRYGSTTLQTDTWYHVVLVCQDNGTTYQMYLNGVPEGGDHTTYSWNNQYSGLIVRYVGRGNSGNQRRVNGSIPITKIYNRVLTEQEIKQNYSAYKKRFN